MINAHISTFWDRACLAKGHTGYADPLLHGYDQPVRLATVGRILDRLFPRGLAGCTALDIGCGTGDFIELLRRRHARVTGVDISAVVLDLARERFGGDKEVTLQAAAVLNLDLPPGSCDVITSVTVMQHILDDEEFVCSLRLLRAALRPHGRMVLLELAPPRAAPVEVKDSSGFVYLLERPLADWRAAFARAGLKVVDEPTFPQLGIALLRGFSWAVEKLRGSPVAPAHSAPTAAAGSAELRRSAAPRGVKGAIVRGVRRTLLLLSWPLDHVLRLPLPPARFRHYRIFVLAPQAPAADSD